MDAIESALVEVQFEGAEIGGHVHDFDLFDKLLTEAAVRDQVGDAAHLEAVLLGKFLQMRQPCHGAIGVHDFDEHPGFTQTGEAGQIHGGLGVAGTAQDATGLGHERVDVAGLHQVLRLAFGSGRRH